MIEHLPPVNQKSFPSLATISAGGKRSVATALALIETARGTPELAALLDDAVTSARAHVTGLTGPPGVANQRWPTHCCAAGATRARASR